MKKSFAIELTEETVELIKAHFDIKKEREVRQILQAAIIQWATPMIIERTVTPMEKRQ